MTSIFTTLKSTFNSLKMIRNSLLNTSHFVSNGPGTCMPFFLIFYVLNKLKVARTKLIFIESWCRVDSISLSGKIVRFFTDKFIVHWEEQKAKYPWTDYYGKILWSVIQGENFDFCQVYTIKRISSDCLKRISIKKTNHGSQQKSIIK